jgi:hypothetical protein
MALEGSLSIASSRWQVRKDLYRVEKLQDLYHVEIHQPPQDQFPLQYISEVLSVNKPSKIPLGYLS